MKKVLVLIAVLLTAAGLLFADGHGFFGTPEGDWKLMGSRLYQQDDGAGRAKAWMMIPQSGPMIYEFTMRYEGGGEDGHGGAGIHILADSKTNGKSWGFGDSWLLWINYDVDPANPDTIRGLSAEAYRSTSNKKMEMVASVSLNPYAGLFLENITADIPVKLTFYPNRGRLVIADPRGETAGWFVDLPGAAGSTGSYVAVRTNGCEVSFTSPDVSL